MLQIRTTISGSDVYLDLYQDEPVNVNLSFAELQDITKKNSNYSQSFSIPGTKKNNEVFNFFYDVNSVPLTFDPNDKFDAVLMWDGYEIMQGHIRLNGVSINKGEIIYSVTFYNQIGDLMANIGDKFLYELNLSGLSHPYTDAVIFESQIDPDLFAITGATNYSYQNGKTFWGLYNIGYEYYAFNNQEFVNSDTTPLVQFSPFSATTSGISYTPVNPYFDFSGTPLNNYYFKPTIQVKTLYEEIFNEAGYELESDFMNTSYFKKFYVPQKFLDETIYPKNALPACYSFTNDILTPSIMTPSWVNPISAITCNDLGFTGTTTGITIPEEYVETYQFRFTFTVAPTQACDYGLFQFPYAVLYFYDGITTEVIYSNTFCDEQASTVSIDRSLIITGTSTFGFYFLGEYSVISGYTQQIINPPRFIPTGSTIDYAEEFPTNDYKQIDFITSINKMFNFVVVPNPDAPQKLMVEPIVDYIGKGVVLDWTNKVDYSQPQNLIPTSALVNGTLEFEFKKDQDYANDDFFKQANRVFGSDQFNLGLPYKNDTTKFDFIFSSPIDITIGNVFTPYITVSSMSKVQTQDASGTTLQTFKPFKILPKIIFRGLTLPNDNYGYIGGTGTTTGSSTCKSGVTFNTNTTCPIYYNDCFGIQQVYYPTVGSNTIPGCLDPSSVRAALVCFPYPIVTITNTGTICGTVTQPTKYQTYFIESQQMDRFQNLNRFTTYPFNYSGFSHYINYRGEDQSNVTQRNFQFLAEDLYDIYYKPYVDDLTSDENKIYSCKIYLLPQDVQRLRWNEKILINNTYFRINKITNFNMLEPNICDIELIKLTREYEGHRKLGYTLIPCSSGDTKYSNSDLNYHLYAYGGNYVELYDDNLNSLGCHQVNVGPYVDGYDYQHYYISSAYTFSGVSVFKDCSCTGRTQMNLTQQSQSQVYYYYQGIECSGSTEYVFRSTGSTLDITGLVYRITNLSTESFVCVSAITSTYVQSVSYEMTSGYTDCTECNLIIPTPTPTPTLTNTPTPTSTPCINCYGYTYTATTSGILSWLDCDGILLDAFVNAGDTYSISCGSGGAREGTVSGNGTIVQGALCSTTCVTPTPTTSPTNTPSITPTRSATPTPTPTFTPTPSTTPINYDADAASYLGRILQSGGTLNSTISAATNTLFITLKNDGVYSKLDVMYPMLGATSGSCSINAIGTGNTMTWAGTGWTFSTSGASSTGGSNTYGNTNFAVSANSLGDMSMSVYMLNNLVITGSGRNYIGAASSTPRYFVIGQDGTPKEFYGVNTAGTSTANSPQPQGWYGISTTGTTSGALYRNGSLVNSAATSTQSTIGQTIYLGAMNSNGTAIQNYQNVYAFAHIGNGLTAAEMSSLYTAVQTFNTSLSRQV